MHILSCRYLYEYTQTNSKGNMYSYVERERYTHDLPEKYQFIYSNPNCFRLIAFCPSQKFRFLKKKFRYIGNSISYHM